MNEQNTDIKYFEDLKVWKQARKLQSKVSKLANIFPKKEQYRLTDQMIRSSRSVARNIVEGYGRYHYQENIQFCRQSRGSLSELSNDFFTAFEENYIDQQQFKKSRKEIEICHRLLNGYIRYLKKAKQSSQAKESEAIYESHTNNE